MPAPETYGEHLNEAHETVADYLRSRAEAPEGRRVALVVQGGGMRGVYSMGALSEIEEQGLQDCFDVVIGSSAGAINGAYLLAGQAHDAVNVYVKHLSNKNFVNFFRARKIVDIDYLVDVALKKLCPLNVEKVRASPTLLEVVVTDSESAATHTFTNRDLDVDFYELIRATAALPGLYDKKIALRDRTYVDGGVVDGVPVLYAIDEGATDVLTVVTRPPGFRRQEASVVLRAVGRLFARRQSPAVRETIGRTDDLFNRSMDLLEGVESRPGLHAWTVWPSDGEQLVGRTTSDEDRLRACALMGARDMRRVLGASIEA